MTYSDSTTKRHNEPQLDALNEFLMEIYPQSKALAITAYLKGQIDFATVCKLTQS